jgi:hypothetical protein
LLNLQLSTEKSEVSEMDYGFLTESLRNPYARRFQCYPLEYSVKTHLSS